MKYAMKTDLVTQNVAMKVDQPKKNDFQPVFLDALQLAKLFEAVMGTKLESLCRRQTTSAAGGIEPQKKAKKRKIAHSSFRTFGKNSPKRG